jgi:hypothetical protein
VCWNAGTACTGGPGTYDECHAADFGIDGLEVAAANAEDDAVLHPLSRYVDGLVGEGPVYIAAIDGVPVGYEDGSADIVYADDADMQLQHDYGIGPGCDEAGETALPSVRIRELVEQVDGGERNDFSACDDSYAAAMQTIAERIVEQLP